MVRREVERIRSLERMLVADGVAVVKVHLHVGPELQRRRLRKLPFGQAHALAGHAGGPLGGRALPPGRACASSTASRSPSSRPHPGTSSTAPTASTGRSRSAACCSPESRAASAARRPAPAAPAELRRAAATRSSRSCRRRTAARGSRRRTTTVRLEELQGRLALLSRRRRFAKHSVVVAFEGMDAGGKGGAIRRITAALDARQYRVVPISAPTPEEIARPYLWRFWFQLPPRGNYTIFDRSWYGRVLVERVHGFAAKPDWQRAYERDQRVRARARRAPRHRRQVLDVGEPRRAAGALQGA